MHIGKLVKLSSTEKNEGLLKGPIKKWIISLDKITSLDFARIYYKLIKHDFYSLHLR